MKVIINGVPKTFKTSLNLSECLAQQGYADMMIAVAHNRTFVPKTQYTQTLLKDGDEIEIVAPMQGG